MSITDFLLARIAEDERLSHWYTLDEGPYEFGEQVRAIYQPRRVLAECEAKRRIVELHLPRGADVLRSRECACCGGDEGYGESWNEDWPCPTLRHLAAVHADHPDYREEWRP